jgi:uncharacterized protein (DUF2237 family)
MTYGGIQVEYREVANLYVIGEAHPSTNDDPLTGFYELALPTTKSC